MLAIKIENLETNETHIRRFDLILPGEASLIIKGYISMENCTVKQVQFIAK